MVRGMHTTLGARYRALAARGFGPLVTLTLWLTLVLIIVGAATRVHDAGMACPDWPQCYGVWVPFPESHVPGGYVVAGQHYVWWQVLLEWGHRGLAAVVGFGLLGLLALAPARPQREWWPLATAVLLLAMQIKLGAVTVWLSNIHWTVALHLGNAMLFLAALAWLRREVASGGQRTPPPVPALMPALIVGFAALVWVTMIIGALVSSSYSGGVCGGLMSCDGQWLPADWQQLLHMKHRYLAVSLVVLSIGLLVAAKRLAPSLRPLALHLHLVLWGQALLGILTLYSFANYPSWYYPLSIAHLTWGTVLWLGAVGGVLTLRYGAAGRFHAAKANQA